MAGVPAQFSSDELGALKREAESHPLVYTEAYRQTCLHEYYEVHRCAAFIQENGFKRVRFFACSELYIYVTAASACLTYNVTSNSGHSLYTYACQIG